MNDGMVPGGPGSSGGTPGAMNPTLADQSVAADEMVPLEDVPPNDSPVEEDLQAEESNQDEQIAEEEGSGGEIADTGFFGFPSFSFPSFFRSFSNNLMGNYRRRGRQLFSPCSDRITLPCIIEDFIGAGMGDAPSACVPVLCGNFLNRIETSITPFQIGVHFGDGRIFKGGPEDNIGACLRYKQLPCS